MNRAPVVSMDFITHTLMGAGVARHSVSRSDWLPQFTLAGMLGSLIQDGDSWLHLLGPNYYGRYHRVVSHSFPGLLTTGIAAGVLAWAAGSIPSWRRFGWFASPNLLPGLSPSRAPLLRLLFVGISAAFLHWCADAITGFGNLHLFWPWSDWEGSLHAVTSFDVLIFSATLGWHILLRSRDRPRRREAVLTGCYVLLVGLYVLARWMWTAPTVW